jgi:hypothetical protein
MDAKEILKSIKDKLTAHFGVVEKFNEAKLNDGVTIVAWDSELLVGEVLYVITEEGKLPAPIGVHTFEDGTIVEVDESGLILSVTMPEAVVEPTEEPVEAQAAPQEQVQVSIPKRVIKSIVEEQQFKLDIEDVEPIVVDLSEIFNKIAEVKNENEKLSVELKSEKAVNKEVFELVAKLADEPSHSKTESKPSSKAVSRKEIKEMFNKLKS